jgi:hypothetical protein
VKNEKVNGRMVKELNGHRNDENIRNNNNKYKHII